MSKIDINPASFSPFINSINSLEDVIRLIDELNTTSRFLFRGKEGTIYQKASDFLPINLASIFLDLEAKGLEPRGDTHQMSFLQTLIGKIRDLPQVKVTLAFEPNKSLIAKINNLISDQVGSKVILDLTVDQYIIGGASFEYKGKYFYYNLAEKLNTSLEEIISKADFQLNQ